MKHNIKQLFVHGCSYIRGDEIEGRFVNRTVYNVKHRWPTLVANNLEISRVVNQAKGGGSNQKIYRESLDYLSKYLDKGKNVDELLVIIGWTGHDRIEVAYDNKVYDLCFGMYDLLKTPGFDVEEFERKYPDAIIDLLPHYFECFADNKHNTDLMVSAILGLQCFLKLNNIKYIFLNSVHEIERDNISKHKANQIDTGRYLYPFESDFSYLKYLTLRNFERTDSFHFQKDGHKAWSEFILSEIEKRNLL